MTVLQSSPRILDRGNPAYEWPPCDDGPATLTVCHPVWRLDRGGLENQLRQTLRCHPSRRLRHILIVRGANANDIAGQFADAESVNVLPEPGAARDPRWSQTLAETLSSRRVDILHVRGLAMLLDGLAAARLAGDIPVALSFHGFEQAPPGFSAIRTRVLRRAIEACADRWAVGAAAARAIEEQFALVPGSFDIVPNGVSVERFRPADDRREAKRRLALPVDRPLVLCVGNLKPIKGHDVLLRAAWNLAQRDCRFQLALVGEDYLDGALQRWSGRRLGGDIVRFPGAADDVIPWYHAADLFVLPSLWEGLSNALLEGMACGLPVIATAVGGNIDLVQDRGTGLLVSPNDADMLSTAMAELLKDADYAAALGRAARQAVVSNHGIRRTAAALAARYARLAKKNAPGPA